MPASRTVHLDFGAVSDPGRVRSNNEDCYRADTRIGLFAVIDGVGGQNAGEVASHTAGEALHAFIERTHDDETITWPFGIDPSLSDIGNRLRIAILLANQALAEQIAGNGEVAGMAATLAAMMVDVPRAVLANVGDCRGYLFRDGALTQVTIDHSWVAEQVRLGILQPDAARTHPMRNIVTRALDGNEHLAVDLVEFSVQENDVLLLCSDGLHSMVPDEEIRRHLLADLPDADVACRNLIQAANEAGGKDNVTAIVVRVAGDDGPARSS
jgi:protein phosphatase